MDLRGPRPPAVAGVAEAMVEQVDDLAERATDAVMESIASYHDHREELARSVRYTIRTFLDFAASGVVPSQQELARLGDVGRRRALGRIPLSDVLHAFRMAVRTILRGFSEDATDLPPDAILWLADSLLAYLDALSKLVTDRYLETQADMVRAQESRRREFLSDLLHGHREGPEALSEAATLGIELLGEARVLVVGAADPASGELADDCERTLIDLMAPTPVLTVRVAGDLVVLPLGPADADSVARGLDGVIVGEGRIHPGLGGIRQSYAEARDALSIARATGKGPVARFSDMVLDRLLRQDPALLTEFVAQTVGPVQAYDARRSTDLVHTLEVWAEEGGSPTAAATRLHVHPHTVSYRLSRVEEITGLQVSTSEDRLQLLLGLRALRLLGDSFVVKPKIRRGDSGPWPDATEARSTR